MVMKFVTFEEFREYAKKHILEYLPSEYANAEVSIQKAVKNNSLTLFGLVIKLPAQSIVPVIYLEGLFQKAVTPGYNGDIFQELADAYLDALNNPVKNKFLGQFQDLNFAKERFLISLLNQRNNEYLQDVPHRDIEGTDLTSVVRIMCPEMEGSGLVKNNLLESWGINENELFQLAMDNSIAKYPPRLMKLDMFQCMNWETMEEFDYSNPFMTILSNKDNMFGFSVVLYPGVLSNIADHYEADLIILPSSIHELILLVDHEGLNACDLLEMVQDANREVVAEDEILSDAVYRFNRKNGKLELVAKVLN